MGPKTTEILVLDAMGVIYQSADDVKDLLAPFILSRGGCGDFEQIEQAYLAASLGKRSPADFWRDVGVDPALEDEYLAAHRLVEGVLDLLDVAHERFAAVYCLSNDVSAWSLKLRRKFGIEPLVDGWIISSDVGWRKPDPHIYAMLIDLAGAAPEQLLFVDDRAKNLDAAKRLGIQTRQFILDGRGDPNHAEIRTLAALMAD